MNILVTGSNGQLGNCIREYHRAEMPVDFVVNNKFIFTDINIEKDVNTDTIRFTKLDITNYDDILALLKEENVNMIINCAAYTNVDKAEDEPNTAYLVNAASVDDLARAAAEVGAKMIHISTDYVFDGKEHKPYTENNITNPINVYGQTKCAGENRLFERLGDNGIVIRTAWLYSNFGKNFVKTMIKLGGERDELNVVFDQVGTPTFGDDLAEVICKIIMSDKWVGGIYNYTNEGICSWYDFAVAIMELYNLDCKVHPVHSKDYKTKAERPLYSVLDKTKIKETYGIDIPYWRDSLKKCLSMNFID